MTNNMQPLHGIRVLDLATFIAAPMAAGILGEFGAEVIKIEQPGLGDPLRRFGVPAEGVDATFCWLSEARNKKSVTLDLRQTEGIEIFKKLVAEADIVCENFRPGRMEHWGLGWDVLHAINPKLVMLRVSGFGQTGPNASRPGFARIAHAFGGLSHLTGEIGGPPLTPGSTSLADYISGIYGALGILLALRTAEQHGVGQYVDLALYEPVLRMLDDLIPAYAAQGVTRGRQGLGTSNACPHGHFRTSDGWVAIACTSDRMFARLAVAMNRTELADADKFGSTQARLAASAKLDAIVQAWTLGMSTEELVSYCAEHDVPCASVNTIEQIFSDEHIASRDNLLKVAHEILGNVTVPGVLPRLSSTPGHVRSLGPGLGSANEEVYGQGLGIDAARLAQLRESGVI